MRTPGAGAARDRDQARPRGKIREPEGDGFDGEVRPAPLQQREEPIGHGGGRDEPADRPQCPVLGAHDPEACRVDERLALRHGLVDRALERLEGRFLERRLLPLRDTSVDVVITDPPYYDMIEYADVSDLFHVWLKRVLFDIEPDLFGQAAQQADGLQDKNQEIIVRRCMSRTG